MGFWIIPYLRALLAGRLMMFPEWLGLLTFMPCTHTTHHTECSSDIPTTAMVHVALSLFPLACWIDVRHFTLEDFEEKT